MHEVRLGKESLMLKRNHVLLISGMFAVVSSGFLYGADNTKPDVSKDVFQGWQEKAVITFDDPIDHMAIDNFFQYFAVGSKDVIALYSLFQGRALAPKKIGSGSCKDLHVNDMSLAFNKALAIGSKQGVHVGRTDEEGKIKLETIYTCDDGNFLHVGLNSLGNYLVACGPIQNNVMVFHGEDSKNFKQIQQITLGSPVQELRVDLFSFLLAGWRAQRNKEDQWTWWEESYKKPISLSSKLFDGGEVKITKLPDDAIQPLATRLSGGGFSVLDRMCRSRTIMCGLQGVY